MYTDQKIPKKILSHDVLVDIFALRTQAPMAGDFYVVVHQDSYFRKGHHGINDFPFVFVIDYSRSPA